MPAVFKQNLSSFLLASPQTRLRKSSSRLTAAAPDVGAVSGRESPMTSAIKPFGHVTAAATDDLCDQVAFWPPQHQETVRRPLMIDRSGAEKVEGDRLSPCIRYWASAGVKKDKEAAGVSTTVAAAGSLCRSLVELDRLLCSVESGSVKYGQDLFPVVSLCDVVARGLLLCCEETGASGVGRYVKSLLVLRGHVERGKEAVAPLCGQGRLAKLSRRKHLRRNCEAVRESVSKFAANHKPELATTEESYERNKFAFLASRVSIPTRAPRIQDWYVPRDEVVREACRRLGIYSSKSVTVAVEADDDSGGVAAAAAAATAAAAAAADKPEEPRVVGLAGPAGCGKSTAAAMVVAREDVRGYFHEGVVWLPVGGRGAKDRIPQLMLRLANLVYDTLVKKSSGSSAPPPRKPCVAADRQNGLAYILGALSHLASSGGGGSDGAQRRRFLIVADDVYEPEVLEELKGIGACVLFTTTRSPSGMRYGDPGKAGGGGVDGGAEEGSDVDLLRLDRIGDREGEVVLRRACGLDDDVELPRPAHDFIKSYGSVVMDITYVGRWGVVRGTADEKAWDTVLNRIFVEGTENGEGGAGGGEERWTRRRWHTAVLLAGLTDLGRVNDKAKDLYLYLGVLPRGLSFLPADVAALLFDDSSCSGADLEAACGLIATLERCSVLTQEEGGRFCMHGSHADFIRDRISAFPLSRKRALARWRKHVATPAALFAWPVEDLVEIWCTVAQLEDPGMAVVRPYDKVLAGMDQSQSAAGGPSKFSAVLERVARFHALAGDFEEAHAKYRRLVDLGESKLSSGGGGGGGGDTGGGGVDKPLLADHLHSLGAISSELGKAKEAHAAHARALALREESLGGSHPDVARSLQALAACASAAGKPEDEHRLLRLALSIWEIGGGAAVGGTEGRLRIPPGVNSLDAATALQSLGDHAVKQGRTAEAEELLRRALAYWEAAQGGDHPNTARGLHSLGVCAYDRGRIQEAAEFYRKSLEIRRRRQGSRHPDVASTMHSLGVCEWKAGRVEEAEKLYRQTLAIRIEALGPEHLKVARTLHSLGGCARSAGRAGEATGLFRRALEIQESKLGPKHRQVAATLHEMGVSAFEAGQMDQAERYFRRALAIKDAAAAAAGPSLDLACTLHDLGAVVLASGGEREGEAEALFLRALEIREKLGASLDAASTLHCLGECAGREGGRGGPPREPGASPSSSSSSPPSALGEEEEEEEEAEARRRAPVERAEKAEGFYRRALDIQEKELGLNHLYVAYTLFQLGRSLLATAAAAGGPAADKDGEGKSKGREKSEEAAEVFARSLAVREKELGRNHEDVLRTVHHLGSCASGLGQVEEAEGWYRRAVAAEELTLGADHPAVGRTIHMLGACVLRAGKIDEGISLLQRALQIPEEEEEEEGERPAAAAGAGAASKNAERAGSKSESKPKSKPTRVRVESSKGHHLDVALTLQQLAVCAADAGRTEDADALFRQVLAIEEKKLGPDHQDVADTLSNLGECALKAKRTEEATAFFQRALKIEEDRFGADQPVLGGTLHCLGLCAEQAGRAEEAEEYFRRSLAIEEKQMGADHPHVAATLADLGASALASGRAAEAEEVLNRALAISEKAEARGGAAASAASAETSSGILHSLAECARNGGRAAEAEGLLKRALEIEEKGSTAAGGAGGGGGVLSSSAAATLGKLGGLAGDAGRMEEAEGYYRRALVLEEERLGGEHPRVVDTLILLGKCLSQQNQKEKTEEAAALHRRALEVVEEKEGDRSLKATGILLDIGLCALTLGRMEEAEVLYRRAWTIESEHLGSDHPDVQATARALEMFAPSK